MTPSMLPAAPPKKSQYSFAGDLDRLPSLSTTALSLETLFNAYQSADQGWPYRMCDLWEQRIEVDAHLRAVLDERREGVARKPWIVQEGGDDEADKQAAVLLERALRNLPNFGATLEWQLQANPYGWALSEIDWQRTDGLTVPVQFIDVPHRRFVFDKDTDSPRLITAVSDTDGVELTPGKWWYTRRTGRLVSAAGLLRTAAIWSHFKSITVRDWLVFADRFGIPYVTGEYEEQASPESKSVLESAVANLGSDGWAVFSDACKIVIHEVKGGGGSEGVHAKLTALCDMQISKLIAGATLLTETTGQASYAIGKVHQGRGYTLKEGDAEWLAQSFEQCIGRPFVHYNGLNAKAPRLKIHLALDVSVLEQCQIASLCANELGLELDEDQIRQMTYLRKPTGAMLVGTKNRAEGNQDETTEETAE